MKFKKLLVMKVLIQASEVDTKYMFERRQVEESLCKSVQK